MGRPHLGPGRHHPSSIDRNSRGESWGYCPIDMPDSMTPLVGLGGGCGRVRRGILHFTLIWKELNPKQKLKHLSGYLVLLLKKWGNACSVHSSIKAGSTPAVLVGGKSVRRSGGAGALLHSRISKQRDSPASEGRPADGCPPPVFLLKYAFGE